ATSESTIQSRYSKKYLGKSPGLSIYTLIANFVAPNAKNIGLNEYEGHALYDVIQGNKTNINIDMVTGDNHSLNQLNFVILDSIDVDYVPSIKDIKDAANNLYSVKTTCCRRLKTDQLYRSKIDQGKLCFSVHHRIRLVDPIAV